MTTPFPGQIAPISRRVIAYVIDALIASGLGIVLGVVLVLIARGAGPDAMMGVLIAGAPLVGLLQLAWFLVYTWMQTQKGSIGARAQGLRLVRQDDGQPLSFGLALLRNIIFGLAASIVVGYFTPLFDASGRFQGWHDKVAGSLVVDTRVDGVTRAVSSRTTAAPPDGASLATPVPPEAPRAAPAATPYPPAPTSIASTPTSFPPRPAPPIPNAVPTAPSTHPTRFSNPLVDTDGNVIDFVPGITQDSAPRASEAPAVEETFVPSFTTEVPASFPRHTADPLGPPQASANATDEDDSEDIEETRISVSGRRLVFTWDDGARVIVSGRTLFGRNPSSEPDAQVAAVRDETLSLSKTHFEAGVDSSGAWVIDRHSTNGTTVVREGQRIPCPPGERVPIRRGDAIEIGDRIVTVGGPA